MQALRLATLPRLLRYLARTGFYAAQTAAMNSQDSARDVYQEVMSVYGDKEIATKMATDQANRDYNGQLAFIRRRELGKYQKTKVYLLIQMLLIISINLFSCKLRGIMK